MWNQLRRTVAPATALITLAEAKAHLRVDTTDEDTLITRLVEVATAAIDGPAGIGKALITQTYELRLDEFPCYGIYLPLGPVQSVSSITYIDSAGATQTVPSGDYKVALKRDPAVITPVYGKAWPTTRLEVDAVTITHIVGYGNAATDIPADLRQAAFLHLGHLYANRESVIVGVMTVEMPLGYQSLVERYRAGRFGI